MAKTDRALKPSSASTKRELLGYLLVACGGFLLAVLWMDLMFDTLVFDQNPGMSQANNDSLELIQSYYRRAIHGADPMRYLVGCAMLVFSLGGVLQAVQRQTWVHYATATAALITVGMAIFRIIPNANRLVFAELPFAANSELAKSIFCDHVLCFITIAIILCIQIAASLQNCMR